jgi:hypothetical protein
MWMMAVKHVMIAVSVLMLLHIFRLIEFAVKGAGGGRQGACLRRVVAGAC